MSSVSPKDASPKERYRPMVTVDCVILTVTELGVSVMLIQRKNAPFQNSWALPGGHVEDPSEDIDAAAARELFEETNVRDVTLEQLGAFGDPTRDPRGRVISIAYMAFVRPESLRPKPGSDAKDVQLFDVERLPRLAFDHDRVIAAALDRLRDRMSDKLQPPPLRPKTLLPPPPMPTPLVPPDAAWFGVEAPTSPESKRAYEAIRLSQVAIVLSVVAILVAALAVLAVLVSAP
jgi:ADP-ribose pyrophosphatase YjhB (NUDIX family)